MILQRLGMPIYLQVKSFILEKIKAGEYNPGMKLPTERDLAVELGISRNTVSAAYKELLMEGVLEARQGRGTFVKNTAEDEDPMGATGSKRERLLKLIDSTMAKAQELGFTLDQFAAIVRIRAQEKAVAVKTMRIAVIACAHEYVDRYIDQIGQAANVHFEGVLLADLLTGSTPVELLSACDIVVVAAEHYLQIAQTMGGESAKLVTIGAVPNLEAVIRLARLSAGTTVGVVAVSSCYVKTLEQLLAKTMIGGLKVVACYSEDTEEIQRFVSSHGVIVVPQERQNLVRRLIQDGQDVISFCYEIDQGSLNQLLARLITDK